MTSATIGWSVAPILNARFFLSVFLSFCFLDYIGDIISMKILKQQIATIGWSVAQILSARWDLCFDDIIFLEDDINEIIEKLSECQIGMI